MCEAHGTPQAKILVLKRHNPPRTSYARQYAAAVNLVKGLPVGVSGSGYVLNLVGKYGTWRYPAPAQA